MTIHAPNARRGLFLDRDGTLIEDVGFLSKPFDIIWFPDTIDCLERLGRHFLLFVVSNQSGIAAGALTADEVAAVNHHIDSALRSHGIEIQKWYVCPHAREDACGCMKPASHFLMEAQREFGVDLARSATIGDHCHDVTFGERVGAQGYYLLTGHGAKHRHALPAGTPVYATLTEAANTILGAFDHPTDI
jgi:D-glycero-D-manno-heptose 1,7-bisphosphate phosphatase